MTSFRIPAILAAALLASPLALAAKPAPQPAQQDAQQQAAQANKAAQPTDVKDYGDWTVRCFPANKMAPCQMVQLRIVEKTKQRILGVLVAYLPARDANLMEISVPLGVALQNGLVLSSDTYKSGVLKFTRCDQQGCYVEGAVGNDVMGSLGRATKAQVQIISMNGKRYNLVFSMKGFNEAHHALVDLAKQKGGGAAPAPAGQ
ncbi:MAG TPA: invasion associated locus B family protein [Rhizomicrobium sp.]|nr:invasion associated locus B family protein [Rhizomicrobium sp.]